MSKIGEQRAFPIPMGGYLTDVGHKCNSAQFGMTYRQWLVGMALQGLLARHWPGEGSDFAPSFRGKGMEQDAAHFAQLAVLNANAAIAEQERVQ